jgi:hypothetical protein
MWANGEEPVDALDAASTSTPTPVFLLDINVIVSRRFGYVDGELATAGLT